MKAVILLIFLATQLSPNAFAQGGEPIDKILSTPFIKADFKKERKLKVLSKPFITHGFMLFNPGKGLIWKTTKPIIDTILIKGEEVRQLDVDETGSGAVGTTNSILTSASVMFLAIMSRDKEKILAIFDYSVSAASNRTIYTLVPKNARLTKLLSYINLIGADRIEEIEIMEQSGDSTRIYISNELLDVSGLTVQEQALFARI